MKKQVKEINGVKYYLLGKNTEGKKVWMLEGSWDCGWYWGFGYLQVLNTRNNLISHQHFDSQIGDYDKFKEFFIETVLTEKEILTLLELMRSFYITKAYANALHNGGANYTSNLCSEIISNESEYNRINKVVIPSIMNTVYNLLENN